MSDEPPGWSEHLEFTDEPKAISPGKDSGTH